MAVFLQHCCIDIRKLAHLGLASVLSHREVPGDPGFSPSPCPMEIRALSCLLSSTDPGFSPSSCPVETLGSLPPLVPWRSGALFLPLLRGDPGSLLPPVLCTSVVLSCPLPCGDLGFSLAPCLVQIWGSLSLSPCYALAM